MIVRRAQDEDRAAIAALHAQSWRDTYRGVLPDALLDDEIAGVMDRRWRKQPIAARDSVLVAEEGGEIVGFVAAWDGVSAYVDNLHVRADARSRGVGRRLLAEAARHFLGLGRRAAYLHVVAANARAKTLYVRLGGRPAGLVDKNLHGTWVANERIEWDDLALLLQRADPGAQPPIP